MPVNSSTETSDILELQRVEFYARSVLSDTLAGYALNSVKVSKIHDYIANSLVYQVRAEIMGENLCKKEHPVHFKVPASWWQHLKEQHLPNWLLKKFPVEYRWITKEVVVEDMALYPKLPQVFPEMSPVMYRTFTEKEQDAR